MTRGALGRIASQTAVASRGTSHDHGGRAGITSRRHSDARAGRRRPSGPSAASARLAASLMHEQRDRDVGHPLPPILRQTALDQRPDVRRHVGRQRGPVRLALQHGRERVGDVFALERAPCPSASRRARRRTPTRRFACPPRVPSPARGSCTPPCPRITPASVAAGVVTVGDCASGVRASTPLASGAASLASPKSSTFTVPSSRTLMFAGFRSRWMIPCSCAASSASAICRAIASASASGMWSLRDPLGQRRSLHQLHDERMDAGRVFESVDVRDVRMVERRQHLRFAAGSARAARDRWRRGPAGP